MVIRAHFLSKENTNTRIKKKKKKSAKGMGKSTGKEKISFLYI